MTTSISDREIEDVIRKDEDKITTIHDKERGGDKRDEERPIGKYERIEKGLPAIPEPLGRHADDLVPEEEEIPRSLIPRQ